MTDIFIESMLYEQNQLLDKFGVEIEEAKIALLESIDPGPFFEAGTEEDKKSGGIFQAILNVLRAIIKAIGDGFKKLGNWMTGAKVTPEGQTARIQGTDPNVVVKLVDGDIADASDALRKAANGQMTIEEAKAFIDKKESVWKTLKTSMIPVAGLAAFFIGKKFTVDKWKAEASNAMSELEQQNRADDPKSDSKLASKVAHLTGDDRRGAAKQTSQMIVNQMNQTVRKGLDLLMSPVREAYQKGFIAKQLMTDADLMETRRGRRELAARDKKKRKAIKAETKQTKKIFKNLKKASNKGAKNIDKQMAAIAKRDNMLSKTYDNI